jgi:lactate dehydrogenase-like 2-hydroxyacid dehydrogenase
MKACILQNGRLSPAFEITLVASSTQETFAAMETLVLKNLRNFFNNGRLLTPLI